MEFNPLSEEFFADPYPVYRYLRDEAPCYRNEEHGFWAVGFGHGIHVCLGAALARLETRLTLDEWATRWPRYSVDEAGCRRVTMSNVAGFANVPVGVGS